MRNSKLIYTLVLTLPWLGCGGGKAIDDGTNKIQRADLDGTNVEGDPAWICTLCW